MKKILLALILSTNIFASGVKRSEVGSMVDQMVKKGIISKAEGEKAKKKLSGLSDQKWQNVQAQGAQMAAQHKGSNPNVSNTVDSAASNIDLNSPQFIKIQEQMKKALAD